MSSASLDDAALRLATAASFDGANMTRDLTGTMISRNRAAGRIFGHSAAETVGHSIRMVVLPEFLREHSNGIHVSLTVLPVATAGQIVGTSHICVWHDQVSTVMGGPSLSLHAAVAASTVARVVCRLRSCCCVSMRGAA